MCYFNHAFCHYRVTWWQLGLNSKEDICVTLCHLLVEAGRAGLSQTPSTAITTMVVYMQKKCACSNEEVHQIRESTAVDNGNSDTRSIQVVLFQLRVLFSLCQWLLRALTLAHCVG